MAKRKNGEGTWGTKNIKGTTYYFFRDSDGKYFYGKTETEVKNKIKNYNKEKKTFSDDIRKVYFGDYLMNWLTTIKQYKVKKRTYDGYCDCVQNLCFKFEGYDIVNKQMTSLSKKMFQDYFNKLGEKYSKASIQKVFFIISQCLDYAIENEDVKMDILKGVEIPSEDNVANKKKKILFLEDADMEKLYHECKRMNTKELHFGKIGTPMYSMNGYAVILLLYTGIRLGELLALTWGDIDFNENKIRISKNSTKIKNRNKAKETDNNYVREISTTKTLSGIRTIPINEYSLEMLRIFEKMNPNHTPDDHVILNARGNVINDRNLTRTLCGMLKRSGCKVEKCGLHALRHSFGSYLIRRKVDIKVVSRLLGHKDVLTTYKYYIHIIDEQLYDAVDLFNFKKEDE